jgi:hypothetical protein
MWRVHVKAHEVRRWRVPARVAVVPAVSAGAARELVARWAAIDAGVPALRSLTAISLAYATAEPVRGVAA